MPASKYPWTKSKAGENKVYNQQQQLFEDDGDNVPHEFDESNARCGDYFGCRIKTALEALGISLRMDVSLTAKLTD